MSQVNETFFTAVGCMDGRVQDVIATFGREKFRAMYPDTITEAGIVGSLAKDPIDEKLLEVLKFKVVDVSIGKHHSSGIIVHGHSECAGNPVSDDQQKKEIEISVKLIQSLVGTIPVKGVFVHRDSSDPAQWVAEEIL